MPVNTAPTPDAAAAANSTGPRSGQFEMSITAFGLLSLSSSSRHTLSPWMLSMLSPVTQTEPPRLLSAKSAAAFDQSPSTLMLRRRYLCPPAILNVFAGLSITSIPNERSTATVTSIYALLSTGGRTRTTLPPSSRGRANRSPVTNWLLTSPRKVYSPEGSLPLSSMLPLAFFMLTPFSEKISSYIPTPRSMSRPVPVKRALSPQAAAMGSMKRRVLPLSRQGNTAPSAVLFFPPFTVTVSPSSLYSAPRAAMQSSVASISSLRARPRILLSPSARAAQMSIRWA